MLGRMASSEGLGWLRRSITVSTCQPASVWNGSLMAPRGGGERHAGEFRQNARRGEIADIAAFHPRGRIETDLAGQSGKIRPVLQLAQHLARVITRRHQNMACAHLVLGRDQAALLLINPAHRVIRDCIGDFGLHEHIAQNALFGLGQAPASLGGFVQAQPYGFERQQALINQRLQRLTENRIARLQRIGIITEIARARLAAHILHRDHSGAHPGGRRPGADALFHEAKLTGARAVAGAVFSIVRAVASGQTGRREGAG